MPVTLANSFEVRKWHGWHQWHQWPRVRLLCELREVWRWARNSNVNVVPDLNQEDPVNKSSLLISVEPRELDAKQKAGSELHLCAVMASNKDQCLCRWGWSWHVVTCVDMWWLVLFPFTLVWASVLSVLDAFARWCCSCTLEAAFAFVAFISLSIFAGCLCQIYFFRPFFLSFMQSPWFDFHLWGLRCWLLHFCRLFCTLGTLDLYTLVNQVGSGKEPLEKASDVESCCATASFHVTQGADCPQFDHVRSLMLDAGFIWRLKGATAAFCGCCSQLYLWQLKGGRTGGWFHFREVDWEKGVCSGVKWCKVVFSHV